MEKHDKRIDAYINKSADFAQPILEHIRKLIHQASPEITETIKWGFPHFDYKGTVCSMAAFKNHCAFGFWKSSLLKDPYKLLSKNTEDAMGQLGRISSLNDLPEDKILIEYIQDAVKLNEAGIKISKKSPQHQKRISKSRIILQLHLSHIPLQKKTLKNSASHIKENTWSG
jgi:hypothetical protein